MLAIRNPLSLFVIAILVMLGVLRSFSPPSPVGADAPDVVFSAVRAEAILRDLLQDGVPHATGTPENAIVRDRVIAHLEAAGYEPEVQSRFHCNPAFGACSPVENIIAVKPGTDGQNAILVTAHYDSVFAGPGAADDGAGVAAILEIARMLADFPPFMNDVVFLVSDSEENGLIGASAFAEHHPLFSRVRLVLNLEARGVTGSSAMFETGEGNRRLIRVMSQNTERPSANSLVYEIYKNMPNDTDFSVYRGKGVLGLNYAFVGGVALYHSPLDDMAHLDIGSMQHHGDNTWAMIGALGDRDLVRVGSREDAGYIDLFSMSLIHYPESITTGLSLFLGVWVMIAIGAAFRKEFRYGQLRWGIVLIPLMAAVLVLGGYLLSWPLGHFRELHPLAHPFPWPGIIALVLMVLCVIYTALKLFTGRVSACAWMILAWLAVFIGTLVLSTKLPTASHIGLIPMAAFALGSIVDLFRKKSPAPLLVASVSGFAAAAYISWYHFFLLGTLFNFQQSMAMAAALLPMILVAMPMLLAYVRRRELGWRPAKWLGGALVLAVVVHLFLPGFTVDRPRDMTLQYVETDGEANGYIVAASQYGTPDRGWARGHGMESTEVNWGLRGPAQRFVRASERLDLPAVGLEQHESVMENGKWRRTLSLTVPANTPAVYLTLPLDARLVEAKIDGVLALDPSLPTRRARSAYRLRLIAPPPGPMTVELTLERPDPVRIEVMSWRELAPGLAAPYLADWPENAQPISIGHHARKIQLFEID